MKYEKTEEGITLIALIITIVILIILSTITLNFAFGEAGLIKITEQAKQMTEESTKQEQEQLNDVMGNISNLLENENTANEGNGIYVAQIGNTKYETLKQAVEAVAEGTKTEIDIIKSFEQAETVEVPEEKDVVIDLQNNDIKITTGTILNKGSLEIKSSNITDAGKVIIQNNENLAISNRGQLLQISSGIYEVNAANNAIKNNGTGTVKITGGKITGCNIEGEMYPVIWNDTSGTILIEGGTLEATVTTLISNYSSGNIVVKGGTLKSDDGVTIDNVANGKVMVQNGFIQSNSNVTLLNSSNGIIEITGGDIQGITSDKRLRATVRNMADGEIIIDGGKIISTIERAVYNDSNGNITIKDGIIQSLALDAVGNYGSGTITISGGEIRGTESEDISYQTVRNSSNGKIIITGGLIDATVGNGKSTAIYNAADGEIVVTGGTIKSSNYAISAIGTGSITIGTDDGTISTTTPEIISPNDIGTIVGKSGRTLNYYDGIIKGGGISTVFNINVPAGKNYYQDTSKALYETTIR